MTVTRHRTPKAADTPSLFRSPPSTRYQGSKLKLLPWIWENLAGTSFDTALDLFGGTACVSYMLKDHGKAVVYNDYLQFNGLIGKALVENSSEHLTDADVDLVLSRQPAVRYDNFIAETFGDIYFTDYENEWLDLVAQNIPALKCQYRQAIAYYALFQSCIAKRPYNLFHRKNLYMRTADVERGFGNQVTWNKPFVQHFKRFVHEANDAVFSTGKDCRALCGDALDVPGRFDLVYVDPPYLNRSGVGVDYLEFYHFLEGIVDYRNWRARVDYDKKHRPIVRCPSAWSSAKSIEAAFASVFERFSESTLVVSYRSDGIPTVEWLISALQRFKRTVRCESLEKYKYVLSTNGNSSEVLIIAQ